MHLGTAVILEAQWQLNREATRRTWATQCTPLRLPALLKVDLLTIAGSSPEFMVRVSLR